MASPFSEEPALRKVARPCDEVQPDIFGKAPEGIRFSPDGRIDLGSDGFDLASLPPDCVAIPLENGGYALVDEEDACRVDEYRWYKSFNNGRNTWYAITPIRKDGKQSTRSMHRVLFGPDRGDRTQVDPKNH